MATKPHSRIRLSALAVAATAIGALVSAAGASAKTLGSLAPPGLSGCTSCDVFQGKTAVGEPKYRVPKGPTGLWKITAWSAQGGTADGIARLRVYRPTATHGQFKLVKQGGDETVPADGHPSFPTSLNVKKGDLLGLRTESNIPAGYESGLFGDVGKVLGCGVGLDQLVGTGTSCPLVSRHFDLVNVSAELTPR